MGRGFGDLPPEVLASAAGTLPNSLHRQVLLDALGGVIDGLGREVERVSEASEVMARLRELRCS